MCSGEVVIARTEPLPPRAEPHEDEVEADHRGRKLRARHEEDLRAMGVEARRVAKRERPTCGLFLTIICMSARPVASGSADTARDKALCGGTPTVVGCRDGGTHAVSTTT